MKVKVVSQNSNPCTRKDVVQIKDLYEVMKNSMIIATSLNTGRVMEIPIIELQRRLINEIKENALEFSPSMKSILRRSSIAKFPIKDESTLDRPLYITPLHLAAESGKVEIIKYLLQSGAYIDSMTSMGIATRSALAVAAKIGHIEATKILLRATSNKVLNKVLKGLHEEASNSLDISSLNAIKLIANIAPNVDEMLYRASWLGCYEIISTLVERGADLRKTFNGKTALQISIERNNPEVENILRSLATEEQAVNGEGDRDEVDNTTTKTDKSSSSADCNASKRQNNDWLNEESKYNYTNTNKEVMIEEKSSLLDLVLKDIYAWMEQFPKWIQSQFLSSTPIKTLIEFVEEQVKVYDKKSTVDLYAKIFLHDISNDPIDEVKDSTDNKITFVKLSSAELVDTNMVFKNQAISGWIFPIASIESNNIFGEAAFNGLLNFNGLNEIDVI